MSYYCTAIANRYHFLKSKTYSTSIWTSLSMTTISMILLVTSTWITMGRYRKKSY